MVAERNQHRILNVLIRIVSASSTFVLAVILSTLFNPLGPDIPVTERRLAPAGSAAGLAVLIPEGYRAMTVRVDEVVGVSGFIMPGSLVDIVIVIEPSDKNQQERISKIVLQNIKVLANGAIFHTRLNEKEAETVKSVTLQVTPEQAEKLANALSEGKLQVVMRNSVD